MGLEDIVSVDITVVNPFIGGGGGGGNPPVPPPWTPADLAADLALWLDPSDTTHRVLNSTFDRIVTAQDKSANGRNFTQPLSTESRRPLVDQIGGVGCFRWSSTGSFLQGTGFAGVTAAEIFMVVKLDADPPAGAQCLYAFGSSTGGNGAPLHPFTDGIVYDLFGTTVRKTTVNPTPSMANVHVYSVTSKSGGWTSRINGTDIFTTATNTVGWATTPILGGGSANVNTVPPDFLIDARMGEVVMFNRELTSDERAKMKTYLENKWFNPWPHTVLICDGDSITAGSTISPNYPDQLVTKLSATLTANGSGTPVTVSSGYAMTNFGTDGDTLANMAANRATDIDPHVHDKGKALLIIGGGSNDLAYGQKTGAQLYSTLQTYCTGARIAGWKVIVWTLLPRSALFQNGTTKSYFDTNRDAYNTLVRAGWQSFADGLVDMALVANMGPNGSELNTTYYYDQVHPTSVGAGLLAAALKPIVQGLF